MVDPLYESEEITAEEVTRLTRAIYGLIVEGKPASVEQVGVQSGLPLPRIRTLIEQFGAERDDRGRITGLGLTLEPTRHQYRADGKTLYTWCAPDALLYPYVLEHTAEVRSTDPVSDERVELVVSPTGVDVARPSSARVSWVRESDPGDVRESFCRSSNFFAREETAERWADGRRGIEILTVEEATRSIRTADLLM